MVLLRVLRLVIVASAAILLSGCLFTYLVKSGYSQLQILNDREPIEKVLKDPKLPMDKRHKLELALKVRDFAQKELRLRPTENYKTYVDLKRPYVSWIVTVARRDKLESKLYWYPVLGSLPYKGYFNQKDAEDEARDFEKDGYDTMVRGVSAYSTLGWFEDPLLNTMIKGPDYHLVNTIIHESTHATLYIKSQADFNERMATFVGNTGTEIFYTKLEGPDSKTLQQIKTENADENLFSQFITQEIKNLKEWYNTHPKATEDDRQAQFKAIQERFKKDVKPKMKTTDYENFPAMKLNNAVLLYLGTYDFDLSDFAALYKKLNGDLEVFLKACKQFESSSDPTADLKKLVNPASSP